MVRHIERPIAAHRRISIDLRPVQIDRAAFDMDRTGHTGYLCPVPIDLSAVEDRTSAAVGHDTRTAIVQRLIVMDAATVHDERAFLQDRYRYSRVIAAARHHVVADLSAVHHTGTAWDIGTDRYGGRLIILQDRLILDRHMTSFDVDDVGILSVIRTAAIENDVSDRQFTAWPDLDHRKSFIFGRYRMSLSIQGHRFPFNGHHWILPPAIQCIE